MNRLKELKVLSSDMKNIRLYLSALGAGAAALLITSCAYDPYAGGGGYGGNYGDGYGYGGSGFSSTTFVRTGSSRWGYDPYAGAYYDYNRRAYYDPYLYGYYPVGYRPRYVYGSPHPGGWRDGNSFIAPPSRVRDYRLNNYRDRVSRYRGLDRSWSNQVSVRDPRTGFRYNPKSFNSKYVNPEGDPRTSEAARRRLLENQSRYQSRNQNSNTFNSNRFNRSDRDRRDFRSASRDGNSFVNTRNSSEDSRRNQAARQQARQQQARQQQVRQQPTTKAERTSNRGGSGDPDTKWAPGKRINRQ